MASPVPPPQLASLEKEVRDTFKLLSTGFQRLDKIKDVKRQSKQLEELTAKMREAKRMIKEFDREIKDSEEGSATPETVKLLTEKKQSLIKELNSYVALRKTYTSSIGNRQELLDGGSFSGPAHDVEVGAASTMSNQETGKVQQMDETDQTTERSRKVVEDTTSVGVETTSASKGQTEQVSTGVNNETDAEDHRFSLKKASKLLKAIGRQIATDRCIMVFLFLLVAGVIAITVVKLLVHPHNKDTQAPVLTPPAARRRLLLISASGVN